MKKSRLLGAVCATVFGLITTSSHAVLIGILPETSGGSDWQAYYDDVADLTWLADANYAMTSGYDADGAMNWVDANNWAAGLTVGGVTGWRLPNTTDIGNDGPDYANTNPGTDYGWNITAHSELSNMYYNVLGNLAYLDTSGNVQTGWGLINIGPFSKIQPNNYWSATDVIDSVSAWDFLMYSGSQGTTDKATDTNQYAWAVYSGDASLVPIPASVWLFGSGLLGLVGMARRKKTA